MGTGLWHVGRSKETRKLSELRKEMASLFTVRLATTSGELVIRRSRVFPLIRVTSIISGEDCDHKGSCKIGGK